MIDMSHSAEKSTFDAIDISEKPIAITHANPFFWHSEKRNKSSELLKVLSESGFRCSLDLRNEKIGYKIRELIISKIPYVVIIGDKEVSSGNISVREYDGTEHKLISVKEFISK